MAVCGVCVKRVTEERIRCPGGDHLFACQPACVRVLVFPPKAGKCTCRYSKVGDRIGTSYVLQVPLCIRLTTTRGAQLPFSVSVTNKPQLMTGNSIERQESERGTVSDSAIDKSTHGHSSSHPATYASGWRESQPRGANKCMELWLSASICSSICRSQNLCHGNFPKRGNGLNG